MDLNTCFETTSSYHTIAFYAHLVPIALAMFLGIFALIKAKSSKLSLVFFAFATTFSLWLVGSLITWTSPDYSQVYFWWSWLDYDAIVFFVLGSMFFTLLARQTVPLWEKIVYVALLVFPFYLTVTGNSITEFNQPVCEALNNLQLTNYKLGAEILMMLAIPWSFALAWRKSNKDKRIRLAMVGLALLLFFVTFAGAEHVADLSGIYEITLYSQFVMPVFLIIILFAITNLGVFEFRLLGSQVLAYALIIMSGSQLIFIQDSTQTTLSLITLGISVLFGLLLLQNAQKEEQVRLRVEELARQLEQANDQQVILIHFITHQIKGFVTKSRNIFSMILDGDFGPVPDQMRPLIEEGFKSDTKGAATIQEILNASNIKSGKVTFKREPFDIAGLISEIVRDLKPGADAKGLALNLDLANAPATYTGDRAQLQNAFKNLIDNSIKYTQSGKVDISLHQESGTVKFKIQDTGVGITQEDMKNLFTEGGHGKESTKVNVESTGFGLYIVKNIIEAHKGKVWAESEGAGKGSCFFVELPA